MKIMDGGSIEGRIYEGTPRDITIKLCEEIAEVLSNGGYHPSGLHVIALLHIAACMVRSEGQESSGVGKMPSLKTMLRVVTHGMTGANWSDQETEEFGKEFVEIIESLGGSKLPPGIKASRMAMPFISPASKEVH